MTPAQRTFLRSFAQKTLRQIQSEEQFYVPGPAPESSGTPADADTSQTTSATPFLQPVPREVFRELVRQAEERRRAAQAAQSTFAKQWAQNYFQKQVGFDWDDALEEDDFQTDWQDAINDNAAFQSYNPIAAFSRSPVMDHLAQMLPWGMRGDARRAVGAASQLYGMLPASGRRQIHQLGTRAAQAAGGFVPNQLAPIVEGIGAQFGLGEVASRGVAGGVVGLTAARMAGGNISAMGESGREIVGTLVKSIQSSMSDVAQAGRQIASVLVNSALSPFGQSGRAIGSMAESTVGGVANIGGTVLGGAGRAAGAIGGIAGTAAGIGIGALGAGAGALAGSAIGIGPLLGGAGGAVIGTFLGMLVGKVLSSITQLFAGILESAGEVAGELGRVIASGIQAAIDIIKDTLDALTAHAGRMREITTSSGLGSGTASGALMNAQALGISPQETVGMFRGSALLQPGRQALIGATGAPGSAEFFLSAQQRYQQLVEQSGNPLIANQVFRSAGYGAMIPQMAMDPSTTAYGLGRAAQMQGAFGLDPDKMREAGEQMTILNGLFSQFVNLVKMKFAQELFPFLSGVFGRLVDYVSENSGQIADFIKKSVLFLVEDVPPLIARGVAFSAGVLAQLAMLIGNFAEWLSEHLPAIGAFFDFLIEKIGGLLEMAGIEVGSGGEGGGGSWGGSAEVTGAGAAGTAAASAGGSEEVTGAGAAGTAAASAGGAPIPQTRRRTVKKPAPGWIRYPLGALGMAFGAAAGGGGSLGVGAIPGALAGYVLFAGAANRFFGSEETIEEPVSPGVSRAQAALRSVADFTGRSSEEGLSARLKAFQNNANKFSDNYQSEMKELLRGLDTTTKNLDKTLREGLNVHVETEYTLSPTDNFLATATAKSSWAQWRKMSQAVG